MRVEELAREGFERAGGLCRRDVERSAPAVDNDLAAAAVDGSDEPVARDSVGDAARQVQVDRPALEERRREDHARGAELDELTGALGGPDAAADAAGQAGTDPRDDGFVRAGVLGRVEVDELHPGIAGEALNPALEIRGFNRQLLALHELDDAAALEIYRWNEHGITAAARGRRSWPEML